MRLRHQLASYSPVSVAAAGYATWRALGRGADPRRQLLEELARDYAASGGVLCGSGTQALQLAIAMGMRGASKGESVALPAFTCFDVASAAIGAAVPITLYDVDPDTLSPNLDALARAFAGGARLAVIAPLYGMPVDWGSLEACAARYGAGLIEDAAQGHGSSWRGSRLGSLGRVSTLSFGRGKGWTGGRGGAVLIRRESKESLGQLSASDFLDEMKTFAALSAQAVFGRPSLYGLPRSVPLLGLGETRYHPPSTLGEMPRVAATCALDSRKSAEREAELRKRNAEWFFDRLPNDGGLRRVAVCDGGVAGYLRLPIKLPRGMASFGDPAGALRLGVAPSYPTTIGELGQVAGRLSGTDGPWPGAAALVRELVTLPTHSQLTMREREELVPMLKEIRN